MSRLIRRIQRFSRTPQGRGLLRTARRAVTDSRRRRTRGRGHGLLGRLATRRY
ncbi:hypothetical protein [Streptomyces fradiae]|uniref:hypothetical protein n=1 Tax=Streptomyces fradiae TaxID=1906 RepID=UPI002943A071|nr:hypothetical protein [Streptomyces fradiae]WOI60633.1 hypothetical protein RYQ63_12365 [Streptomyces fradiae]